MPCSDYFGFGLVCKRFRDLVRHGAALESTAFLWNGQPGYSSVQRVELFVEWLATRVGRPCSDLLLQLVPPPVYLGSYAYASIRQSLWCVLGQLAQQLTVLDLRGSNDLIPKVGNWTAGFSRLESLSLTSQDCGLTVTANLAGLTRLTHLGLLATIAQPEFHQLAEEDAQMASYRGARLALPEGNFLPTGLRSLRLGSPLLQTLPLQLSTLTGLTSLYLESRRQVPVEMLCDRLLPLAPGLRRLHVMSGMAPPAFLPHLAAFTSLDALDVSRNQWSVDDVPGADGMQQIVDLLQQGLAPLTNLTQPGLADMALPALPPAVTTMSGLIYLECSMNLPSLTLPAGQYLGSVVWLAVDWDTLASSAAVMSSLHKLEELCVAVLPAGTEAGATVAAVLRSLAKLPRLSGGLTTRLLLPANTVGCGCPGLLLSTAACSCLCKARCGSPLLKWCIRGCHDCSSVPNPLLLPPPLLPSSLACSAVLQP
jgi:hypothetical protein